jgi:hypothetical protein
VLHARSLRARRCSAGGQRDHRARIRLLRASWVSSARPSASSRGGR